MGLLSAFGLARSKDIQAQNMPAVYDAPFSNSYGFGGINNYTSSIDRQSAISVPSISQCRNLITGVISGIPLEMYSESTGEELVSPSWIKQLDQRAPLSITLAWIVDSLIFYGQSFLKVETVYQDDQRPASFEWIQNSRVTTKLDQFSQHVEYYMVNGVRVPDSGVGSLITIQSFDQGILLRSARTIQSAIDIEKAANVAAQNPSPNGYLKNNGADLPDNQIQGLLSVWKNARANRSTAFLTASLDYVPVSYSPAEMTYNDSIDNLSAQVARMMNVPASMINAERMKSATYQNILDARKEFFAYTLAPYINCIENRFSLNDLTPRGQIVRFAVDETFLRANPADRLAVTEKLLSLQLIDLNQAKQMEGLAPDGSNEQDAPNLQ